MIEVQGIRIGMLKKDYVVLLHSDGGSRVLPITVDAGQAHSIQLRLQGLEFARPLTHDLLKDVITSLGARVQRVEICDLRGHTFYARLVLAGAGGEIQVDSRPSDAIALAVRCSVPILVDENVMEQAGVVVSGDNAEHKPEPTEVNLLEERLKKAVEEERYENAAAIRDEIKRLKESGKSN